MKTIKSFMVIAFLLLGSIAANKLYAQHPYGALKWQKFMGGRTGFENLNSIKTSDGGTDPSPDNDPKLDATLEEARIKQVEEVA